ncbi:hypothetical protein [Coleofasciculus sp. E2-BRE-01]
MLPHPAGVGVMGCRVSGVGKIFFPINSPIPLSVGINWQFAHEFHPLGR